MSCSKEYLKRSLVTASQRPVCWFQIRRVVHDLAHIADKGDGDVLSWYVASFATAKVI